MKDDLDDLSARARRGELGEADLHELEQRHQGSHEARLSHRAGLEFDAEDLVLAGDEALVARINQRLLSGRRPQRRPRFRAIGLVVGGVCTTVAAAAAGPGLVEGVEALWQRSFGYQVPFEAAPAPSPRTSLAPRAPGKAVSTSLPIASPAPGESAPAPGVPEPVVRPPAPRAVGAHALPEGASEPVVDTSASLFAEASLARRQGDAPRAMALYSELLKRFPGAAEADSAEIALGMLSLQAGAPAQGLLHFERYLSERPGGQLAVEALWGKTRALAALGREDEARRDLLVLVNRYPRSTYAPAARAKLGMSP